MNDPERWRVHAWVEFNGQRFDPTYELTWTDSGMSLQDVEYYELVQTDCLPEDLKLSAVRGIAREHGIDAVLLGDAEWQPTVEILLLGKTDGKRRKEHLSTQCWVDIRDALERMGSTFSRCTIQIYWPDDSSDQFLLAGDGDKFVLQRTTDEPWLVLAAAQSSDKRTSLSCLGKVFEVSARHVVTRKELIEAMEEVFRQREGKPRWEAAEYLFVS